MKLGTVELDGLGVSYKDDELKMVWRLDDTGRMELVAPETGNAGGKDGNCIVDPRRLCVRMIRTVTPGERLAPSLASSNLLIGLPHP